MKSLNRATILGNLTEDPSGSTTERGVAVSNFSVATERSWKTKDGEQHEETEYHRIVAWDKLGELCTQFLKKGDRAYVEGRLTSHKYTGTDGIERTSTEIVAENVVFL